MARNLKKRSTEIKKFSGMQVGDSICGTFCGNRQRQITDRKTGELKDITDCLFNDEEGNRFAIAQDTGLRVEMSSTEVKVGEFVQITKKEQMKLDGGGYCNQYEILVDTPE